MALILLRISRRQCRRPVASLTQMKRARAQAALQEMTVEGHGPGLFGLVTQDGQEMFSGSAGLADLRGGRKIRACDRFRIGSITKTYVAVLACLLEDLGVLSLADTAGRWLPEYQIDPSLTIEHLLRLRSSSPLHETSPGSSTP